ncbi:MAG: hypothetical protein SH850_11775 [Planctomycetaceae bacterium]|nr:hypothetical protein [Planctomycetaceae bacterium]
MNRDDAFGQFEMSSDTLTWFVRQTNISGYSVRVTGRSPRPTDEQIQLWSQLTSRFPEVLKVAIESIHPHSKAIPRQANPVYRLFEVRFEAGHRIMLRFDPGTVSVDGVEVYPMTIFQEWELVESSWVC